MPRLLALTGTTVHTETLRENMTKQNKMLDVKSVTEH